MDSFCLDKWPQFRAQGLVRHQIHWSAKQVLKVELHAKVPFRIGRAVEADEDINVAGWGGLIANCGSKEGQISDAIAPH